MQTTCGTCRILGCRISSGFESGLVDVTFLTLPDTVFYPRVVGFSYVFLGCSGDMLWVSTVALKMVKNCEKYDMRVELAALLHFPLF